MTMTKKEFAEKVAEIVGAKGVKEVVKNGVTFTAVEVGVDDGICACYYIDDDYDNGLNAEESAENVKRVMEKQDNKELQDRVSAFAESIVNYDEIKDKLILRMYNKSSADGYPINRSAEEYGFDDLILVPAIRENEYSAVVTEQLLEKWEITEDELFEKCIENIRDDVKIKSIIEVLSELLGVSKEELPDYDEDGEDSMFVISNEDKIFGAVAVLFAKDKLNEIFPNGYAVLPSSVHEVIAVAIPDEVQTFNEMVQEVNATQVEPHEVLSNKAYLFA